MSASLAAIGGTLGDIATPALVLDLDEFEANIENMQRLTEAAGIALRPHGKAHRCSAIAKAQLAAGAVGICCQTVGEAERFRENGIDDIFISNVIVDPAKIHRLARLAMRTKVAVCVDDARVVPLLEAAAREAGCTVEVLIEVDVGDHRLGIADPQGVAALARNVSNCLHLKFGGLQAYIGRAQHERDPLARRNLAYETGVAATRINDVLAATGIVCPRITGGGTGTVADDCDFAALTEVQPGSYVFLDVDYSRNQLCEKSVRFNQSLFILTQVVSVAAADHVICDAGLKAFSMDSGLPEVHAAPGLRPVRVSDEHVKIACGGVRPELGERLLLIPGHCDPTVNLHDQIIGLRSGRVESVWAMDARGASA
jgi:D-serine deaminase-like pyridoxal phosphate-dependent protein